MALQTCIANTDVYKGSFFPQTIRDWNSPTGTQYMLCFLIGPVCNWLPIYEMSNLVHFTIKIQKLLTVYSQLNNIIRKITCLFILWLNHFFHSHVLITLFDGFCLTLSSISLVASMASSPSSGIEGKSLVDALREVWHKMVASFLKWRRPNSSDLRIP